MMSQKTQRKYETFTLEEIQYLVSLGDMEVEKEWNEQILATNEGLDIYNYLKEREYYDLNNEENGEGNQFSSQT